MFFKLLATTGTLYFVTYPATRLSDTPIIPTSIPHAQQRKQDLSGAGDPAWHTWQLLNPRGDPLVHLRTEAPTLLMFHPADAAQSGTRLQSSHRTRPSLSYSWIMRTSAWMARIVVFPIAATVALLYALLLYLLKDAERLEAQRHRAEPESSHSPENAEPPKAPLAFAALPRAHSTDIELLAASRDGRTVAAVSVGNELVLWNNGSAAPIALDAADVLGVGPSSLSAAITALTLDDTGSFCVVGTGVGVVAIWALPAPAGGSPQRVLRGASSAVTGIYFVNTRIPGRSTSMPLSRPDHMPTIFVTHENGKIVEWDGEKPDSPMAVSPPRGRRMIRSTILRIPDSNRFVGGFAFEDGSLDIVDLVPGFDPPLAVECHLQAGNPTDTVASFYVCTVELGSVRTLVIAVATEAGVVSLWDGNTGSCIALLDEPYGTLKVMRICTSACKSCTRCGALLSNTFVLILTAGAVVHFFRVYLPSDNSSSTATSSSRRTCPHNSPSPPEASPWGSLLEPHSRTPSTVSATPVPPPRSRHASMSEDSAPFPVSGHGVLSRRASEKDSLRRAAAADTLAVPENAASDTPLGPLDPPQIPARWRSLVISRIADTTCERGSWDVAGSRVLGLRRRSRKPPDSHTNVTGSGDAACVFSEHTRRDCGLSAASLERWEAWTFDPVEARVSVSPLAALERAAAPAFVVRPAVTRETPRLPFTRVRPLISGKTSFLAGFGNTVGLLMPTDTDREVNVRC
jgi:WD40 repeat protein